MLACIVHVKITGYVYGARGSFPVPLHMVSAIALQASCVTVYPDGWGLSAPPTCSPSGRQPSWSGALSSTNLRPLRSAAQLVGQLGGSQLHQPVVPQVGSPRLHLHLLAQLVGGSQLHQPAVPQVGSPVGQGLSAPPTCGPSGQQPSAPPAPVTPGGRGHSAPPICGPSGRDLSAPPAPVGSDGRGFGTPPRHYTVGHAVIVMQQTGGWFRHFQMGKRSASPSNGCRMDLDRGFIEMVDLLRSIHLSLTAFCGGLSGCGLGAGQPWVALVPLRTPCCVGVRELSGVTVSAVGRGLSAPLSAAFLVGGLSAPHVTVFPVGRGLSVPPVCSLPGRGTSYLYIL